MSTPPQTEETLARIKPSLRSTVPTWGVGILLAMVATWLIQTFDGVVVAIAQLVANLLGDFFPYDSWYFWLMAIVWVGFLVRPAYAVLAAMTTEFEFTNQRLNYTRGVLHRRRDQIELMRIRDLTATRRLSERLFGLGTLRLDTVDRSHPVLEIPAQPRVYDLKDWVHRLNTRERERLGYREFEGTHAVD